MFVCAASLTSWASESWVSRLQDEPVRTNKALRNNRFKKPGSGISGRTAGEQFCCARRRSPKKYRSPSRKGGISPASRAVEGRAGLKLSSRAGNGPPTFGSESAVTNPGRSESEIRAKDSQACAADPAGRETRTLRPRLSPMRGSIATLFVSSSHTSSDSAPVTPVRPE
jgi:hypothetical protein